MKATHLFGSLVAVLAVSGGVAFSAPETGAMSAKECHQAFQAAKKGGTLNGQNYDAFKTSHCAVSSTATVSAALPDHGPDDHGKVIFPSRIAPEFASLSAGKARMQTCLAQYNANKANGSNGGLKWVQKGGGYWPQCTAHLKEIGAK